MNSILKRVDKQAERPLELKPLPIAIGLILIVFAVWLFFHYRHSWHHITLLIQSLGTVGIVVAILLMAFFCVIPVPSEGLILVNMEVYGVLWGLVYSWIGGVVGAVVAMYLTRWIGQGFVRRLIPSERQRQVDQWMAKRGTFGLLALRLTPFPYHALNYAAGLLNVRFFPFLWTTALGIIPFDIWMGGFFVGFSHGVIPAIISVLAAVVLLGGFSFLFRGKLVSVFRPERDDEEKPPTRDDDPSADSVIERLGK
ncbi:TVP38/TMEM64 family protein [Ferroacidibacillus organovorans]|uniref:TVP38/TMEM64 family membrane protein n=1 Tax=Ferroacidibacillus organovorans TaxID=1765683 RepID=A0A162S4L1_9BACL|nr:VTT domain-containing protein [Ferroacidibacillus organovorans]KYP79518.1 hypothetical protein AYJ22_14520 [Ferroacidibacillus organovorans]OAG87248.1 hypothetical protein AYW79_14745 [Ferroacidibacillus organovorans]OPG17468.1 TVP38/TMEM64 family protein [Ferroacidibacillus organovorans]